MTTIEFNSAPKEELLIAAKACRESARGHFEIAKKAASLNQYGIGNSLLILAAEECIKSAILLAGYFNITVPFPIEPYFKDHKAKHGQAAEIQPLINFIWQVREGFTTILSDRKSGYKTVFEMGIAYVFASIGFKLHQEHTQIVDFGAWWKTANQQKNNGFYVGFANGKWNFPVETDPSIYNETLSIVTPFVECLDIVEKLQPGDNILFSTDKKFTDQEIKDSGIKLTPVDSDKGLDTLDLSEYKEVSRGDTSKN